MVLVPQVVDAVRPLPVVAAGGIFDGRGLAAALVLGAAGVNVGTRFIASVEAAPSDAYKAMVTGAVSEDAVKVEVLNDIMPTGNASYGTVLRAIRSPFIEEWQSKREEARRDAERLRRQVTDAIRANRAEDVLPTAGQTAGGITEVLPAAEVVRRMVEEAEEALAGALRMR